MLLRISRRELFAVQLALTLVACSTASAEGAIPTEQVCTPDIAQAAELGVMGSTIGRLYMGPSESMQPVTRRL
jgi:hypothetical protein